MTKGSSGTLLFFLAFSFIASAQQPSSLPASPQQTLTGRILKKGGQEVLAGVTVYNFRKGRHNVSDIGGNYKIPAGIGDTVIFTSAGYLPDTLVVASYMLGESLVVRLDPNVMRLPSLQVDEASNYQMDSMKRREDYAFILNKKHPVKLMNGKRPGDGPGLSFSPIGYFSKNETRKRRLKKRLAQEEKDYYIDYKFPPARVAQLTGLRGDSLQLFLVRYRPSYPFCRTANNQDILFYINEKMKLFRKTQPLIPRRIHP
ncbi:MAG TPA: hypothetical protein VE035_10805 [Puia sp.]|nr:hypothetical protein [Puia sp.]